MKKKTYDATDELGVPVTLIDTVSEDEEGTIEIPDLDMLLATVAVTRVLEPARMVGRSSFAFCAMSSTAREANLPRRSTSATRPSSPAGRTTRRGRAASRRKSFGNSVLNLLAGRAPGVEIGENAVPGMKIRPRGEALPLAFAYARRNVGPGGRPVRCYVPVSGGRTTSETEIPAMAEA